MFEDSSNSEMENAGAKSDSDDAWEEDNVEENKEAMDQNNDDDENMEM